MKIFKKLVIGSFVTIMALAALIVVVDQPLMLSTGKSDLPPRMSAPPDRKSTRLNSSHSQQSRMPSSA